MSIVEMVKSLRKERLILYIFLISSIAVNLFFIICTLALLHDSYQEEANLDRQEAVSMELDKQEAKQATKGE